MTRLELQTALAGLGTDSALITRIRHDRPWLIDPLWWKKRLDEALTSRTSRRVTGGRTPHNIRL